MTRKGLHERLTAAANEKRIALGIPADAFYKSIKGNLLVKKKDLPGNHVFYVEEVL